MAKSKKNTPPKKSTTSAPSLLAPAIMMLVSGLGGVEVVASLVRKYKVSKVEAERVLKEARGKITTASTVSAREELGFSITHLKDLYRKSIESQDLKTALSTLKEKNRLLGLYDSDDLELISESAATRTEELVRGHLEPLVIGLGLGKEGLPLEEVARLISLYIVSSDVKEE